MMEGESRKNKLKCKWCDFTVQRFKGYHKPNNSKLQNHVVNAHEIEFLESMGFVGTLDEYLDMMESEEGWPD